MQPPQPRWSPSNNGAHHRRQPPSIDATRQQLQTPATASGPELPPDASASAAPQGTPDPEPRPGMGPRSSRRFANRVWTSPAYKKARQERIFRKPKAFVIARDSPMSTSCADNIGKLHCAHVILPSTLDEASREDLLQCLWCRSVAALIGCLDTFASGGGGGL